METNSKILKEIDDAISSGKYKVADLNMFNIINELKINEDLVGHLEYTEELLIEYLNKIFELKDTVPGLKEYLASIKAGDIVDNHSLEKENSFLIGLHMQLSNETAIDKLIRYNKEGKNLTKEELCNIHSTLLNGTSSDRNNSVRDKNNKFVGSFVNGTRIIDYFPMDYREIDEALIKMTDLYNNRLLDKNFDNIFFQPFLIHGLFGALQMFYDGNTRMGRLMQHVLIWKLINEKTDYQFDSPPIYATRNYYPFREEYRKLISDLVKNNNNEAWNNWFEFNLRRIEDQIYKNNENIAFLKRRIKKR